MTVNENKNCSWRGLAWNLLPQKSQQQQFKVLDCTQGQAPGPLERSTLYKKNFYVLKGTKKMPGNTAAIPAESKPEKTV